MNVFEGHRSRLYRAEERNSELEEISNKGFCTKMKTEKNRIEIRHPRMWEIAKIIILQNIKRFKFGGKHKRNRNNFF